MAARAVQVLSLPSKISARRLIRARRQPCRP